MKGKRSGEVSVEIKGLNFGSITIDGKEYAKDVVIDRGIVKERKKKASKKYKEEFGGHTPLTTEENIPWRCKVLVIGSGHNGALPIEENVIREAKDREIELKVFDTPDAVDYLKKLKKSDIRETNAVLHLTC